jgi:hypothetical protein
LLRGERGQQPAGRRRPPGERVDQFLEVARPLGEEVAVALHELVEGGGGVLAAGVGVEHGVELGQHAPDPVHVLLARPGERIAHALEAAVEQLAPEQVTDLLVEVGGFWRTPLAVGELADGTGGVGGELVQLGLVEPRLVGRVRRERGPLGVEGLVEQLPDAVEGAAEVALAG